MIFSSWRWHLHTEGVAKSERSNQPQPCRTGRDRGLDYPNHCVMWNVSEEKIYLEFIIVFIAGSEGREKIFGIVIVLLLKEGIGRDWRETERERERGGRGGGKGEREREREREREEIVEDDCVPLSLKRIWMEGDVRDWLHCSVERRKRWEGENKGERERCVRDWLHCIALSRRERVRHEWVAVGCLDGSTASPSAVIVARCQRLAWISCRRLGGWRRAISCWLEIRYGLQCHPALCVRISFHYPVK